MVPNAVIAPNTTTTVRAALARNCVSSLSSCRDVPTRITSFRSMNAASQNKPNRTAPVRNFGMNRTASVKNSFPMSPVHMTRSPLLVVHYRLSRQLPVAGA